MSRPLQLLVGFAALAVIAWVAWQVVEAIHPPDQKTADRGRAECALAESDLEGFLSGGGLPPGVDEEKLELFVSACRARRALGEF